MKPNKFKKKLLRDLRKQTPNGHLSCFYCERAVLFVGKERGRKPDRRATIDHVIPKCTGVDPCDRTNIVVACVCCNTTKANQPPEKFIQSNWLKRRKVEAKTLNDEDRRNGAYGSL